MPLLLVCLMIRSEFQQGHRIADYVPSNHVGKKLLQPRRHSFVTKRVFVGVRVYMNEQKKI